MNPLIYIIPIIVIAIICIVGFLNARRLAVKNQQFAAVEETKKPQRKDIYELPSVNQQSDNPLGAVQSTIRGRIRFVLFGILFIAVGFFALYILYFTDRKFYFERTSIDMLIGTILLLGSILWGLQLISYATYRVKLRRSGFEMSSIFGTKSYEYKDVDFYLARTIEHKYESEGYRPIFMKSGNYNHIWQCQIIFRDSRKPIILKSSRYAWLQSKIAKLQHALDMPLS